MRKYDLEERLIDFAVLIINLTEKVEKNKAGNHLVGQILRSGTSPALNYGEAQAAESKKDFIHKMKISLKELRETHVNARIIQKAELCSEKKELEKMMKENNELIAIFVASLKTAEKK